MSLIGLLLVLAPTIVFSIINPDILKLQIGAGALKTQFADSPSEPITSSSPQTTQCSLFNDPVAITAQGKACNAAKNYQSIASSCCKGAAADTLCCATPK